MGEKNRWLYCKAFMEGKIMTRRAPSDKSIKDFFAGNWIGKDGKRLITFILTAHILNWIHFISMSAMGMYLFLKSKPTSNGSDSSLWAAGRLLMWNSCRKCCLIEDLWLLYLTSEMANWMTTENDLWFDKLRTKEWWIQYDSGFTHKIALSR